MTDTRKIELRQAYRHHGEVWTGIVESPILYVGMGAVKIEGFAPDPGNPELHAMLCGDRDPRIDMWIGAYGVTLEELLVNREWDIRDSVGGGAPYRTILPGTELRIVLRGAATAVRVFVELEHVAPVVQAEPCTRMIQIRAPESWVEAVDRWRSEQRIRLSRSEAIRILSTQAIENGTRL